MPALPKARDEKLAQNLAKGTMSVQAACRDAGFSDNPSLCTRKSNHPDIRARVAELRELRTRAVDNLFVREMESSAQIAQRLGITRERIIQGLFFNAQRCLRGTPVLDANGVQTGKYSGKPDASGANQAFKLLGMECFGMFVERVEIGGPGDFSRLNDAEFEAEFAKIAGEAGLDEQAVAGLLEYKPSPDDGTEKD